MTLAFNKYLIAVIVATLAALAAVLFMLSDSTLVKAQQPQGDIVFVIDESGSMGPDIDDVKARVSNIGSQLGASIDFQLGLVGFGAVPPHEGTTISGEPHIHLALTNDLSAFGNALGELVASGGFEPGFAATSLAMSDAMGFRANAGSCVILITDEDADPPGEPAHSDQKTQAIADLQARGAAWFGVVAPNFGTTAADYGPNLGSLSAETGGAVFNILDFRQDADPVLQAVLAACVQAIEERDQEVPFDVKPGSCPNPLNTRGRGVLPAAIVGSEDFDVSDVDVSTVQLEGVSPLRWNMEDVATPYDGGISDPPDRNECTDEMADGIMDLTLKFDAQEVVAALGPVAAGDVVVVQLTGNLLDGTPIVGQDVVWIR